MIFHFLSVFSSGLIVQQVNENEISLDTLNSWYIGGKIKVQALRIAENVFFLNAFKLVI